MANDRYLWLKKTLLLLGLLIGIATVLTLLTSNVRAEKDKKEGLNKMSERALLERGRYLVTTVGACSECHNPWKFDPKLQTLVPDENRGLMGTPAGTLPPMKTKRVGAGEVVFDFANKVFRGPWGTTFATNITPDKTTGIGRWSFQQFKEIIRTGKYMPQGADKAKRQVMPPMPWPYFAHATDYDLRAIYEYLMSRPPVRNQVPEYIPPSQGRIGVLAISVNAMQKKKMSRILEESVQRGEYLVTIGHCDLCHTPWVMKSGQMMPDHTRYLSGSPEGTRPPASVPVLPEATFDFLNKEVSGAWGTSFAANLTPDKETGIGNWTFSDFRNVIRTGKYRSQWSGRMNGRPIMPPMPWEYLAGMTDRDLHDIYNYLMSIKPIKNRVPEYIPPSHQ